MIQKYNCSKIAWTLWCWIQD